jgi:hypothetical protein
LQHPRQCQLAGLLPPLLWGQTAAGRCVWLHQRCCFWLALHAPPQEKQAGRLPYCHPCLLLLLLLLLP